MNSALEAVVVDAVRSPMGRGRSGGSLSLVHPVDLLGQVLRALVDRSGLDAALVDDVVVGCVSQVGEQSATPGRMALLAAGFPESVPSVTIDRKCGSSQQAIQFAAQGVMAGTYDIVIAAGVESMSRVPMGTARMDADPWGEGVRARYSPGLISQGIASELVSEKWKFQREDLDAFAVRSHAKAHAAGSAGAFENEIIPIAVATDEGIHFIASDETIRPGSSLESLGRLKPAFDDDAARSRFPNLSFHSTAGNSSQITDGASAVLIMTRQKAEQFGLRPRARFLGFSQVGGDPLLMLTAVMPATRRVLNRSGKRISDVDLFEVNEAFASVPLAWQLEFGVDDDVLNVCGGAIALGHPLGASGARIFTTLLNEMERRQAQLGLQTICEAGGMANALLLQRLTE
ncbi:MAG: thiolase family protein [Candidatus Nanopelagicales bacterium]